MIRILYISPNSCLYGAEQSLLLLIRGLDTSKYTPIVLCPEYGPFTVKLDQYNIQYQVHRYEFINKRTPMNYLLWLEKCKKIIKIIKPTIIHCNERHVCQFISPLSKLFHIPIVCHVRQYINYYEDLITFSRFSDKLISNSFAMQSNLVGLGYKTNKIKVIYNPIEDIYNSLSTRNTTGKVNIGIIGQVIPRKGHDILFSSLAAVTTRNWECHIYGDVTSNILYRSELKCMANELNIADRLIWHGYRNDPTSIFAKLDLVVVPSREETFGRVAAEAMYASLPVIAANVGGLPEVIDDGITGLLFPSQDVSALAKAIEALIVDQARRHRFGILGRERASSLFNVDAHINAVIKIYKDLLS
jgi:glycosyltransferase involved in cell wall biosynthesis